MQIHSIATVAFFALRATPAHGGAALLLPYFALPAGLLMAQVARALAPSLCGIRASHDAIARRLRLDHVLDNPVTALSGGQKKLVEIGRALMAEPKIAG